MLPSVVVRDLQDSPLVKFLAAFVSLSMKHTEVFQMKVSTSRMS